MRDLHARMLAALLDGEGLGGLAELAAEEAGGPVALVLPARGLAAASAADVALDELERVVVARVRGDETRTFPPAVEIELPIEVGERTIGYALALAAQANGLPNVAVDRQEVLRTAALAALTEVAVADARDEVATDLRGSLLEELRSGALDAAEVLRRAARLGCDLSRGAVVLIAELDATRPGHVAALIAGEHPGAISEALRVEASAADPGGERVYALLPPDGGEDAGSRALDSARALAARLRPRGAVAFSSLCPDPADLARAVAEAELMLSVIARDERIAERLGEGLGDGVYRLLLRAMATDPREVRSFYEETVEPLVSHDREYRTDLLGTLESYLANDCNMNSTARAVFAHRHTVAHRLARIRELTGLDPALSDDRERLGLGIKAYRLLEPTLKR